MIEIYISYWHIGPEGILVFLRMQYNTKGSNVQGAFETVKLFIQGWRQFSEGADSSDEGAKIRLKGYYASKSLVDLNLSYTTTCAYAPATP